MCAFYDLRDSRDADRLIRPGQIRYDGIAAFDVSLHLVSIADAAVKFRNTPNRDVRDLVLLVGVETRVALWTTTSCTTSR